MTEKRKQTPLASRSAFSGDDGVSRTSLSAVAFFDVLGFTSAMRRAARRGRSDELLQRIEKTLTGWYKTARDQFDDDENREKRSWEVNAFTDNVVIGQPIGGRGDGESELGHVMRDIAMLQFWFALDGLFVRGGIAIGELYMDRDIVYGVGLLDASESEKRADVPRVILHDTAASMVRRHLKYYRRVADSPQARLLLRDEDGKLFVNYLSAVAVGDEVDYQLISDHRDIVVSHLHEFRREPRVWAKYGWVARYHNFFCSRLRNAAAYEIDVRLLSLEARTLNQVYRNRRKQPSKNTGRGNSRPRS